MQIDSLPVAAKQPKLRWYQWTLRSLFLLTLFVAIGMSWLATTIQEQRRQKAVADAIREEWGQADYQVTWLGKLLRDDSLVRVTRVAFFKKSSPADLALAHLDTLRQLQVVDVWRTTLTDAGLAHLDGLNQLEKLRLYRTRVTDAGWMHIKGLCQLRRLSLWPGTNVTDADLVYLEGLSWLEWLFLDHTQITDSGLCILKRCTTWKW